MDFNDYPFFIQSRYTISTPASLQTLFKIEGQVKSFIGLEFYQSEFILCIIPL